MIPKLKSTLLFPTFMIILLSFSPSLMAAETIEVVESEAGFYYTVQEGDTLWDLSNHFNDSPWLWPELWQENDQITNPHWIFPGERIRLYKKSGAQQIAKTDATAPIHPEVGAPHSLAAAPPAKKAAAGQFFTYPPINCVGFIRKPAVSPIGKIFEVQGRKVLISEGDIVYIQPTGDTQQSRLIPGSQHTIYRTMKPTDDHHATEIIGTQHYILGIVEVISNEPDLSIAKVLKSYRDIRINDMLMPFYPHSPKVPIKPSTPGIDGQIIISEEHTDLIGDYMLAFIDKGKSDNIEVGQQYELYKKQKTALAKNHIATKELPPVGIGTVLVLHTEETTSTVIVTDAVKAIAPGERFMTPFN